MAFCTYCKCEINCSGQGAAQLKQHPGMMKHKNSIGINAGASQTKFVTKTNSNYFAKRVDKTPTNAYSKVEAGKKGATNVPTPPKDAVPSADKAVICLNSQNMELKVELLWALKVCQWNSSFASCSDLKELFSALFPDSVIARNF